MPTHIAFLRAINVGGRNVTMAVLRSHFAEMGLTEVETFIASGNVLFKTRSRGSAGDTAWEKKIERKLKDGLGYEVSAFVRSIAEVAGIAGYEPFSKKQMASASALNVAFIAAPLDAAALARLKELETDIDTFHAHGREVYWLCRKKQSESKFSNAVFERMLKTRATFRSLTTIKKLAEKHGGAA
jgi:uncharacterized protein (DUF1697 family)